MKTGAQIAGKQDGNLTENVELDLFAKFSNVHYVYYKTDNGEHGRILHTEALADGEKIIPVSENYGYKAEVDMYLSAGPGTQSPINRTVNIRSAAQTVFYPLSGSKKSKLDTLCIKWWNGSRSAAGFLW